MSEGRTLYEVTKDWWKKKRAAPLETTIFNPMQAKVGSHVRLINHHEFGDSLWKVVAIDEWQRLINGQQFPMVDYVLNATNDDGSRPVVTLRLIFQDTTQVWLLTQRWPEENPGPHPWDEESPFVLDALMAPKGELVQHAGTAKEERYWRDTNCVLATVTHLEDKNGDGVVSACEAFRQDMTLWTFRTNRPDSAGTVTEYHLHAQLSGFYDPDTKEVTGGDKTILMLAGELVPTDKIMLY